MVDFTALRTAKPEAWGRHAEEWGKVSQHCEQSSADLAVGVRNLNAHWPDRAGALGTQELGNLANDYGDAGDSCKQVATILQSLATGAAQTKSDLQSALDYARDKGLTVTPNRGSVHVTGPSDKSWEIQETSARITNAVNAATKVDEDHRAQLESITTKVGSPRPDPGGAWSTEPDLQMEPGAVNSTGRQLVDQANAAQTANKNLLGPSEFGVVGGHSLSTTTPLNDNPDWECLLALGFCAYRWRRHLSGLVHRVAQVGQNVTSSSHAYDAADAETANLLKNTLTDLKG